MKTLLVLAAGLIWPATWAERAVVNLPFVVSPTGEGEFAVVNLNASTARAAFPPGDIMITSLRFRGLYVDGERILFHMHLNMLKVPFERRKYHLQWSQGVPVLVPVDMILPERNRNPQPGTPYWNKTISTPLPEGYILAYPPFDRFDDDYVFHHNVIHQGTGGDFDHEHAAISYGTSEKVNDFAPYGIRLRPDSPIFSCLHASNSMQEPATFVARWEAEYEAMPAPPARDPRALVVAWVHTEPLRSLNMVAWKERLNLDTDAAEFTHPFRVTLHKAVKLVAIMVHSHHWLRRLTINHNGINLRCEGKG